MISINLKCVKAQCLNILKPVSDPMGLVKYYGVSLIIPPTYKDLYLLRKSILLEAGDLATPVKSPLKHGDSDLDNLSIFAKTQKQPIVLNADGSDADIEQRVKGLEEDNYFDVSVSLVKYSYDDINGVICVLNNIKFRNQ